MTLEEMKKLASLLSSRDRDFVRRATVASRYYKCKNDILKKGYLRDITGLRSADNRIPSNFLYILITAKASYLASNIVTIDVGNEADNDKIMDVLGDKWPQVLYELIVLASIAGVSYIHFWIDSDGQFQYAPVEAIHVMPIESNDLIKTLEGVVYQHQIIDEGKYKTELDYFTDNETYFYVNPDGESYNYDKLEEYFPWKNYKQSMPDTPNVMIHGMGEVPFIKLKNNYYEASDLNPVKALIDAYDKVMSGYINDLEDIQQVFMVLKGYEGEDLESFKDMLRNFKIIKLETDDEVKGDLQVQSIDIPYEARDSLLALLRKRIFEDGQGIDPDPENFSNSSGTALQHLYDNLELKSSQIEMYFRPGIERLVRAICKHLGISPKYVKQVWTRNIPSDDLTMSQVVTSLQGIISQRSQLELLPFIDDVDAEIARIEDEQNDTTGYTGLFDVSTGQQRQLLDREIPVTRGESEQGYSSQSSQRQETISGVSENNRETN